MKRYNFMRVLYTEYILQFTLLYYTQFSMILSFCFAEKFKMLDLDYTGHPIFDVGLAAIVAYVDRDRPIELTEETLYKAAEFIEDHYTKQPLTSFLTTSLMNSDFTQPAFKDNMDRRIKYAQLVARSFGEDEPKSEEVCVFTGKPALGRALSLKTDKEGREELPPGRAYRQHIPLITSEISNSSRHTTLLGEL